MSTTSSSSTTSTTKVATKAQAKGALSAALADYRAKATSAGRAAKALTDEQAASLVAGGTLVVAGTDEVVASTLAAIEQRAAKALAAGGRTLPMPNAEAWVDKVHKAKAPSVGRVGLGLAPELAEPMRAAVKAAQADGMGLVAASQAWAQAQGAAKCLSVRPFAQWCEVWADEAKASGQPWGWAACQAIALKAGAAYGKAPIVAKVAELAKGGDAEAKAAQAAHQAEVKAKADEQAAKVKAAQAARAAKAKAAKAATTQAAKAKATTSKAAPKAKATSKAQAPKASAPKAPRGRTVAKATTQAAA